MMRDAAEPLPRERATVRTAFAAALAIGAAACASGPLTLTDDEKCDDIRVRAGETIVFELRAHLGAGYRWVIAELPGFVKDDGEPEFIRPAYMRPGAPQVQAMRFVATANGSGTLGLDYRRPWEKDAKPVKTLRCKVSVG